ncbi:thioredoxin family protein [Schlesneria sp.]|uniref:thioredoxin family protein n=1 Tax=Schlesneria sp. TaxID=2762018 RepID=UPI002F207635
MQHRVSLRGRATASLWTMLVATLLVVVACSWITATSISAQAADPNNILLDFSAKWCGPCQQMSPIVSKLERQGYSIRQVDIDVEKGLAEKYHIESIPCFVLIANGREISRINGMTDEKKLKSMLMMLPKQNGDDAMASLPPSRKGQALPETKGESRSGDDKKLFPKIAPLFSKSKGPKKAPADEPETFRLQNADASPKMDQISREAFAASTRIRVLDGSHIHYGSGTVIESKPGRAIILSCGHILRNLGKKAVIEVDLFPEPNTKPQVAVAEIIDYDLDADVGLLSIPCDNRLPVVKLGFGPGVPQVEDRVFSIGCGGGKLPSLEEHVVTGINSVVGPDNIECTGIPEQGRSGGGLFLGREQVGICIFADANYKRGIYAGMKPVAQMLAKAKLGHLVPKGMAKEAEAQEEIAAVVPEDEEPLLGSPEEIAPEGAEHEGDVAGEMLAEALRDSAPGSSLPGAAGDYVDAEIVCIIRPKQPGVASRVVIVNQASTRFVDDLLHESTSNPRPTAVAASNKSKTKAPIRRTNAVASNTASQRATTRKGPVATADMSRPQRNFETSFEARRGSRN